MYRKTLDKAWALDFDRLVISHFPMPLDKNVLKDYMEWRTTWIIAPERLFPHRSRRIPQRGSA